MSSNLQAQSLPKTSKEIQNAIQQAELESRKIKNEEHRDDIDNRRKLSKWIISIFVGYIVVVLGIVFACGWGWLTLSDSVMITLLSTTTANIVGLMTIILRYLFPCKQ